MRSISIKPKRNWRKKCLKGIPRTERGSGRSDAGDDVEPAGRHETVLLGRRHRFRGGARAGPAPERFAYDRLTPDGLLELVRFVDSAPGCDPQGQSLHLDALVRVRRAAAARAAILHLEGGDRELAGDLFQAASFGQHFPGAVRVAQIAALADLKVRTVTNAIARGELTAVTADDDQAVTPAELYPRLLNRPGFVAWPGSPAGRHRIAARVLAAPTRARYGMLMTEIAGWVPEVSLPEDTARSGRP